MQLLMMCKSTYKVSEAALPMLQHTSRSYIKQCVGLMICHVSNDPFGSLHERWCLLQTYITCYPEGVIYEGRREIERYRERANEERRKESENVHTWSSLRTASVGSQLAQVVEKPAKYNMHTHHYHIHTEMTSSKCMRKKCTCCKERKSCPRASACFLARCTRHRHLHTETDTIS